MTLLIEQIRNGIENKHPSYFYILAGKLFAAGKKDDAVFWFYAGQLRYRVYLVMNKDKLEPSGDPALFASLSEEIGRPLNKYAFGWENGASALSSGTRLHKYKWGRSRRLQHSLE
jgi:hypothetical protein